MGSVLCQNRKSADQDLQKKGAEIGRLFLHATNQIRSRLRPLPVWGCWSLGWVRIRMGPAKHPMIPQLLFNAASRVSLLHQSQHSSDQESLSCLARIGRCAPCITLRPSPRFLQSPRSFQTSTPRFNRRTMCERLSGTSSIHHLSWIQGTCLPLHPRLLLILQDVGLFNLLLSPPP